MLCLANETNAEWVRVAVAKPDAILIDHAHCEKKAAAFALAMINRYPQRTRLVKDMIDLAKEELEHFETVVLILEQRGVTLTVDRGNPYAKALHDHIRTSEPHRLLDSLIVGAFIEARSCERFSLLAKHATEPAMRELYASLLASEAGHYRAYTDIAREYFPVTDVKERLTAFAGIEAAIVAALPNAPTMHG
ncbi:MAG: tRNA-(ms[2]io[6]A)-hydroxylase [Candidatus Kapabacteria bacterium]|jgi:tRNA-(ms[2]io[6]A)-hydroxylase|nr:tRNA-(ms[2]io[6]A)-hydroxylase [Candidatus Kapabacteria bacterium]